MLFGHNIIDKTKDEHLRDLAAMARDSETLIFLDTNILSYLYKLHTDARLEFFSWTDSVLRENRLRIPAWSAGEYLSCVRTRTLHSYTPKNKDHAQPKAALNTMLETASLFVDDAVLQAINFSGDRTKFLNEFRKAVDALPQFTNAFKHQFDPEAVHEEIQKHLSQTIINSDVVDHCARAAREGAVRIEHRIPPAFRDEGKPENRFGDLIIWFEILENSKQFAKEFDKVLFITNDEKSDWVYSPQRRMEEVRGKRKVVPNGPPELKLVDPRLVSEFQRIVGHANIVISSLPSLIEGLSKDNALDFEQLAAAIQINFSDALTSTTTATTQAQSDFPEEMPAEAPLRVPPQDICGVEPLTAETECNAPLDGITEGEVRATPAPTPPLSYEPNALKDGAYEADAPSEINEIIRALRSHNWYTQNPAIDQISTIREYEFPPPSWFVLGRNIYQAACGNSQKAMDFVANLGIQLSRFPIKSAQHLLAGMLYEIYFDSQGEFRNKPKARFIEKPLQQVAADQFSDVREFILHHLRDHQGKLGFMPGNTALVTLHLISNQIAAENNAPEDDRTCELQSAQLNGVEMLRRHKAPEAEFAGFFGSHGLTAGDIAHNVSRRLAIPLWAITRSFEPAVSPNMEFVIPEGKMVCIEAALPESTT